MESMMRSKDTVPLHGLALRDILKTHTDMFKGICGLNGNFPNEMTANPWISKDLKSNFHSDIYQLLKIGQAVLCLGLTFLEDI